MEHEVPKQGVALRNLGDILRLLACRDAMNENERHPPLQLNQCVKLVRLAFPVNLTVALGWLGTRSVAAAVIINGRNDRAGTSASALLRRTCRVMKTRRNKQSAAMSSKALETKETLESDLVG